MALFRVLPLSQNHYRQIRVKISTQYIFLWWTVMSSNVLLIRQIIGNDLTLIAYHFKTEKTDINSSLEPKNVSKIIDKFLR